MSRATDFNLSSAARVVARFGRITSLRRSAEHNRRVGGVSNSYHLLGRAMDIARSPGVSHSSIRHALLAAGYTIIESLDEGDHSHFAFAPTAATQFLSKQRRTNDVAFAATQWRIISAPAR